MPLQNDLKVTDFTTAVAPILKIMDEYHGKNEPIKEGQDCKFIRRSPICVSDVVDIQGTQYVDLVQEGGGVHGIALAGYTYILEKMGIAFMKMAGTSAGCINTLLLSAVSTKAEMSILKQCKPGTPSGKGWDQSLHYDTTSLNADNYYETRSEKLLEYLAAKPLRELVDGPKNWKKLLLNLFVGKVDFVVLKKYFKKLGCFGLVLLAALVLLIATAGTLSIRSIFVGTSNWLAWVVAGISFIIALVFIYIIAQAVRMWLLYKYFKKSFGINPGEDLESWLTEKLLENGIHNVSHLKSKLQMERQCLQPGYYPVADTPKTSNAANISANDTWMQSFSQLKNEIDDLNGVSLTTTDRKDISGIKDRVGQINYKLMQLAKKISPDVDDKHMRATMLLQLFYPIIQFNNELNQVGIPGAEEIKTSFDKEMAMVCSDITNGIKVEFPGMHKMYWGEDYNISPSAYVRGSMSVPFFFEPFKITYQDSQVPIIEKEWRDLLNIDKRLGKGSSALLVDGGLLSNFPVNIFYNPDSPVPTKPTFGVKLEFEDDARSANINSVTSLVGSMVSTMRYFYDRDFISKHNIFKKTVRSIDTGKIHWLNFALIEDNQIELFYRGALTAAIFLLTSTPSENVNEKIKQLVSSGKTVTYKQKTIDIYKQVKDAIFLTEDNSAEDISFNWNEYKKERILHLSETQASTNRLKRKASYGKTP